MTKESFKDKFSFDKRKTESEKIKKKNMRIEYQ